MRCSTDLRAHKVWLTMHQNSMQSYKEMMQANAHVPPCKLIRSAGALAPHPAPARGAAIFCKDFLQGKAVVELVAGWSLESPWLWIGTGAHLLQPPSQHP